jgi:pseudouridine kinase
VFTQTLYIIFIKSLSGEVTGAGDSFVSGIGYGYINGLSLTDTVKYAQAMSVITISHEDTIHPDMNDEFVKENINKISWTEEKYY